MHRFVFAERGHDRIQDFNGAEGDRIDLRGLGLHNRDLHLTGAGLAVDLDGDGVADLTISLQSGAAMTLTDILLT